MKQTICSLLSVVTFSSMAMAGGNVAEIDPVPIVVPDESGFYLGLGVGQGSVYDDFSTEEMTANILVLQAGYQYNRYLAFEGRYSLEFSTDYEPGILAGIANPYDGKFSSWGMYVKPMYPIGDFSLYALLGYGEVMLSDLKGGDAVEGGFQWGLGASYDFTESITVFVDYVRLYDDVGFDYRAKTVDVDADEWTVGVTYNF